MAMQIHQFQQHAEDLECGHRMRWAGAIESSTGDHVIALDCAKCVSSQSALDSLREFALYVHLSGTQAQFRGIQPDVKSRVMGAY